MLYEEAVRRTRQKSPKNEEETVSGETVTVVVIEGDQKEPQFGDPRSMLVNFPQLTGKAGKMTDSGFRHVLFQW